MSRTTCLLFALFLTFAATSTLAQQPTEEGVESAEETEGAEPEEGFEGVGVEVMADPVFSAAFFAFEEAHNVSCTLTAGGHEGAAPEGGTLHALFVCMSNEEGASDNRSIEATGWWTPYGSGVTTITLGAAE